MPSQLEEAALRYRGQLLRQERVAASEMVRAYAAAWQRTQARLAELQEQIDAARRAGLIPGPFTPRQPGGPVIEQAPGTFSLSWLYERDRLTTLLRQMEGELRQFGALAGELTEAGQMQAVQAAQANAETLVNTALRQAAGPEAVGMFNRMSREAVQDLVGFASDGSPLRELFEALGPRVSRGVQDALVTAVATGIGPRETARLVRREFGMGLSRALTIARTEQIRAYREASRRSYAENADLLDGWVWLSARDSRTCVSCWAMHGTRHRVTETLDDHPNGRCTMVPIVKGHDPNIPTGEELFRDLPPAQQQQIMGKAGHLAYQAGAVRLADFAGQRDDPRWGTMRYAKSLREVVGEAEAKVWIKQANKSKAGYTEFKTLHEAEAWGKSAFAQWEASLSKAERDAFEHYQSTAYKPINEKLRRDEPLRSSDKRWADGLDSALSRASVNQNVVVYRGFSSDEIVQNFQRLPGTIITDKGFVSTSVDKLIGNKFAAYALDDGATPIFAEIRLPKGTRAAYINTLPSLGESEIIIARGTQFKVVSAKVESGVYKLVLEVINAN